MTPTRPTDDPATRLADDYLERLEEACATVRVPRGTRRRLVSQTGKRFDDARAEAPDHAAAAVLGVIKALGEPDALAADAIAYPLRPGATQNAPKVSREEIARLAAERADAAPADKPKASRRAGRRRAAIDAGGRETNERGSDAADADDQLGSDASEEHDLRPVDPAGASAPANPMGRTELVAVIGIGAGWLLSGIFWLVGAAALLRSNRWAPRDKAIALIAPWLAIAFPLVPLIKLVTVDDPYVVETIGMAELLPTIVVAIVAWAPAGWYLVWRLDRR